MSWTQVYDPLGSPLLSTLLAALPIVLLLGLLATGRVSTPTAALIALSGALLIAVFAYVPPSAGTRSLGYGERVAQWLPSMAMAAANGAAFGLFPIGWIVVAAIFLYTLTVETGRFEVVKRSVAAISGDRRIQALLIAFSFGAFIEGAAGFGTPVAISAALMMGAGFRPLLAAGLALIANTSPVAFGALGTPTLTLASVTQLPVEKLSAMAGRQLPFFSLIVPVWLVATLSGRKGVIGVWPALVASGGSFALVQFLVSNYHGPELVDIAGGLASMLALVVLLRFWKPAQVWRFADEIEPAAATGAADAAPLPARAVASAWVPWLLLSVFVFLWGLPTVKGVLGNPRLEHAAFDASEHELLAAPTYLSVKVPLLHRQVARDWPVVKAREEEKAVFDLNWLSATGTGIFFAAVASAAWLRVGPRRFARAFTSTLARLRRPLFTIACMLAIAFVTRYSGMDATLGLAFTKTGWLYPFFAALLGWLGVALTGSDTSSNALFGGLQRITAEQLGLDPVLITSANSTGGVMGKMIDAQSIVVSAAATGRQGEEGQILRFVFWHSLALAALMGLLVLAQAHFLSWMVP